MATTRSRLSRISLALVSAGALLASTFASAALPHASAETTSDAAAAVTTDSALAYNGLNPNTGSITTDGITHSVGLQVTDASGNTALTNIAEDPESLSIINPDAASVSIVFNFSNETSAPLRLNQWLLTPIYFDASALTVDASGFDTNGLTAANGNQNLGDVSLTYAGTAGTAVPWASYSSSYSPEDLWEMNAAGTLAAGQSISLSIPLTLPDPVDISADYAEFQLGELTWTETSGSIFTFNRTRFATQCTMSGDSSLPFTGKYLAALKTTDADGNPVYTYIPELQQYMPTAELGENYWVNNFGQAEEGSTTESVLYTGGSDAVDTAPIADALASHGYSIEVNPADGSLLGTYYYNVDSLTGCSSEDGYTAAPYVSVRQVVAAEDATITVNDPFDVATNLGAKVYDRTGAEVSLDSDDVTIEGIPADTSVPGGYPITITYGPDAVSLTVTLTIQPLSVTPIEPTFDDHQIVIPTVPGVDYQIDGATVTGTISVPEGETVTVTAVPQASYAFPHGTKASWDYSWSSDSGSTGGDNTGTTDDAAASSSDTTDGTSVSTGGDADASDLAGVGAALALIGAGAAALSRRKR